MKTLKEFLPLAAVGAAARVAAPYVARAMTRAGPSTIATAPVTTSQQAKSAWQKAKSAFASRKAVKKVKEDVPAMSTSAIPDPKTTVQGPSQLFKPRTVTDRRYKKRAIMIKPFRDYMKDKT